MDLDNILHKEAEAQSLHIEAFITTDEVVLCQQIDENTARWWFERKPIIDKNHYIIIGGNTGLTIGCTTGEIGREDVLMEEPDASFRLVPSGSTCPICSKLV